MPIDLPYNFNLLLFFQDNILLSNKLLIGLIIRSSIQKVIPHQKTIIQSHCHSSIYHYVIIFITIQFCSTFKFKSLFDPDVNNPGVPPQQKKSPTCQSYLIFRCNPFHFNQPPFVTAVITIFLFSLFVALETENRLNVSISTNG